MQTKKLFNISQQDFVLMDRSIENLTAIIAVNGFNDTDEIELTQHDICETALAFRLIDNYANPTTDEVDFQIDDYGMTINFHAWWESVDPEDIDKIFSAAIATKVDIQLDAISKELFQVAVAA